MRDRSNEQICGMRAVFGGFCAAYILMIEPPTPADLQEDTRPTERLALPQPAMGE